MITRADVADLRDGDVVEMTIAHCPGFTSRGPVASDGQQLRFGPDVLRTEGGHVAIWAQREGYALTVISRAKPPLYVNSDRSEPVAGDVVRDADSNDPLALFIYALDPGEDSDDPWPWLCTDADWQARHGLPTRLRLLVDGTTGQVVR